VQHELLAKIVEALDAAGIKHMVTGSFASTFHGEPRMTRDIDIVIDPDTTTIAVFVEQFDTNTFYIDDAIAATARRDMFNVIDVTTGWKVDLIICKDRAFSKEEFQRRVPTTIGGVATYVASAEDTILSKLEWSARSGSERQRRDVVSVIQVQRSTLDFDYLEYWANELDIADQLQAALDASS
jgi:nicotinamide riboside kinase